jgi:hypothetical protein
VFNAETGAILLKTPLSAATNAPIAIDGGCPIAGADLPLPTFRRNSNIAYNLGATGKLPVLGISVTPAAGRPRE